MGPGRELKCKGRVGAGKGDRGNRRQRRHGTPNAPSSLPGTGHHAMVSVSPGLAPLVSSCSDTKCLVPGSGNLVPSAPELQHPAKEALMSVPRGKFERQNGNAQHGGWEAEWGLLPCLCSRICSRLWVVFPRTACPVQLWGYCQPWGRCCFGVPHADLLSGAQSLFAPSPLQTSHTDARCTMCRAIFATLLRSAMPSAKEEDFHRGDVQLRSMKREAGVPVCDRWGVVGAGCHPSSASS